MEQRQEKKSLKLQAYDYLREKILSCTFAPGEFLTETGLCQSMGNISRTPMRDALSRLEQDGLIRILPKKGIVVTGIRAEDVNHVYEVRALLEPYTLRVYGASIDREALRQLRDSMLADDRLHKPEAYYNALDDRFHELIIQALPNQYLCATYQNITSLNSRFRILCGKSANNRVPQNYQEHLAVLDACLAQDWNKAAELLHYHLEQGRLATFALILQQAQPGEAAPDAKAEASAD